MKRVSIACSVVLVAGAATTLVLEHRAGIRLREQNRALQEEIEQLTRLEDAHRPLSPLQLQAHLTSALPAEQWRELLRLRGELGALKQQKVEAGRLRVDNARMRSNWVEQIISGKKLSLAQVEPYLKTKQRNAESLLAAFQMTGEVDLLREALEKHPSDPRVAFAACFSGKGELTPSERRERLDALKQAAPDNALADYLSAQEHFKSGQTAEAVRELIAASGKPVFQDYYAELAASLEEGYEAAGLSSLEAAMAATSQPLPQLKELKGLGENLGELAQRYRKAGDEASAQAAVQMAVALGHQVVQPAPRSTMIGEFVGLAIEREILKTLDPTSPYDASGHSVKQRLDEIVQEREARQTLLKKSEKLLQTLSGPELASYYDRLRASGEAEALRSLLSPVQP